MWGRRTLGILCAGVLAAAGAACGDDDDGPEPSTGMAIVSIGDSVASGEGNPHPRRPPWEERRCHRSAAAGQSLAGRQEVIEDPTLTFHSFACSGATVEKGLLGPYRGIEPAPFQDPARPQVEEVAGVKAVSEGGLAAVLVSVGANDIGFVKIVKFCALVPRCRAQHFNPELPFAEAGRRQPTLEGWVRGRLEELPGRYRRLDAALSPLLEPERVIIVEYFDSTSGPSGDCTMLFGGVKPDESRWARESVLVPLNATIAAAAEEHGWRLVSGVDESFRGHGICAGADRWVLRLGEGPVSGTLHPNAEGHRRIAALISSAMDDVLED